jgi:hypothetical protein
MQSDAGLLFKMRVKYGGGEPADRLSNSYACLVVLPNACFSAPFI